MADGNNKPGGNSPLENNGDQDKTLQILQRADDRIRALLVSTDAANKSMGKFSSAFINATKNVKLLNEELRTLKTLSSNIRIPNIKGGKVSGGGVASSGVADKKSEELKARLELEKNLKFIKQKFGHIKNSDKDIAEYRSKLYREHYAKFGVPNAESTEYEKKMTDLRHADALAASGTTAAKKNAAKIYENYGMKDKADAIYKAVGGGSKATEFDKIDDFWSMLGLGRKSKWESYKKNPVQMNKKDGVMGDVAEGISGMKEKLTTLVTAHPYTAALLGIGVTLKFISDRVTELNRLAEKADKTNAEYLVLANQLMLGRTEHDKTAFEREQERLKKERIDAAKEQKDGETWSALVGWIGDIGRNISMGYKKWAIGDDYEDQELSATIATAVKQTFDTLTASGATYDTAKNVGVEAYNLGLKYSENWLQQPSEMAANIAKAIAGDQSVMSQYGLNVNDKVLAGYVQYMYGEDMVNVEHTDTYKQIRRAELIEKELSMLTDSAYGVKALTNFTSQLYATGDAMEHFKQTLFGFDEVITLDAYDTTRPEVVGNHEVGDTGFDDMIAKFDTTLVDVFDDSALAKGVQALVSGKDEQKGESPSPLPGGETNLETVPYTLNIDASDIEDAFYDGSDYAYDMIYKAFKDGSELFNDLKIGVDINMPSGGTGNGDLTTLMMMLLLPSLLKGTGGGGNNDVFTDLPSGAPDDNANLYLNPIDTSAPASFLGYGPEQSSAKEWGFAWGGPGSATDILIDVTGDNSYIGNRMTMTDSEAREWASANYYRFGPDEDGSTPARGVDVGDFYQPNSSSSDGGSSSGVDKVKEALWDIFLGVSYPFRELYDYFDSKSGGHRFADGGIGTREIHNATLFEGNNKEAVIPLETPEGISYLSSALQEAGMASGGAGGDSITINLTLTGLNISNNQADWQWVAQKIAEEIDVQRQRRGELNYGASY